MKGAGRATYYEPGPKFPTGNEKRAGSAAETNQLELSEESSADAARVSSESHKQTAESDKQTAESDKQTKDYEQLMDRLPGELEERVREARSQKRVAHLEELLVQICGAAWFTSRELASLLDRNRLKLNSSYLTPLVERGILKHRHPDSPRHPNQAYRTVAPEDDGD